MPVDTSMYLQNPLRTVADYEGQLINQRLNQQAIQQNALKQDEYARGLNEQAQVRNLLSGTKTPEEAIQVLRTSGLQSGLAHADLIEKNLIERKKQEAVTAKTGAEVSAAHVKLMKDMAGVIAANPTPQTWTGVLNDWEGRTGLPAGAVRTAFAQAGNDPEQIKRIAFSIAAEADKLLPKTEVRDAGGSLPVVSIDAVSGTPTITGTIQKTQSPDNAASVAAQLRGQNLTDARARELNSITREAQQSQVVVDPIQGPLIINKGTKSVVQPTKADGTTVPGEQKVAAQKLAGQLASGIAMARDLIPKATASGAGAMADATAGFFGAATPGADAASQLETLAGWMTSNVPRMQGPQSDKDTLLYKQMAAQVGDRTKPASARLKALDTLESLQKKYAEINGVKFESGGGASGGWKVERQ